MVDYNMVEYSIDIRILDAGSKAEDKGVSMNSGL